MICNFGDKTTEDIWNGETTTASLKIPLKIWQIAQRKLDIINTANELLDLQAPPGNRLKKLKGTLQNYYSIRINEQYRIVFKWNKGAAFEVRITDYH